MDVLAKRNSSADDTAEVEDGPEDTDEATLLALGWVAHHERALGRPQKTSADTEDGTGCNNEAARVGVHVQSPVHEATV